MLPGATNILDQLLGGFEIKPSGVTGSTGASGTTGVSAEGEPQGLIFGDLLLQTVADGEMIGRPGEQLLTNLLFPSNDQLAAQDEAPAGPTVERTSLIEGVSALIPEFDVVGNVISKNSSLSTPSAVKSQSIEQPLNLLIANQVDLASLLQTESEVESGIYRVLDSKVSDGRLELTVVAKGPAQEPVKISVPAALLTESVSKLIGGVAKASEGRIPKVLIDRFARPQQGQVDTLLSRLNLKALEIKVEPQPVSAKPELTPVEITLVAENDGAQVALKSKISKQDIRVITGRTSRDDLTTAPTDKGKAPVVDTDESSVVKAGRPDNISDPLRKAGHLTEFSLPDRIGTGKRPAFSQDIPTTNVTIDRNLESITTGVDRKLAATVKMTLPELIQKPFSPNGQTIMIRIEPAHLGPARLNLSLRDQILTARVIVDTPMARMAILNSLEQLTNQLSRAGIEVDRIEVALSGDGAREQFLDRRSAWSHARKMRRFDKELGFGQEAVGSTPVVTAPPPGYLRADGVNLLA